MNESLVNERSSLIPQVVNSRPRKAILPIRRQVADELGSRGGGGVGNIVHKVV